MTLAKKISLTFVNALLFWKTKQESELPIKRKIGENWCWDAIRCHKMSFGWGTKVYVQNWLELSNDILHRFCLANAHQSGL